MTQPDKLFDIEAVEGAAMAILLHAVPHGEKHTLHAYPLNAQQR